jgi:LPPG:FO 2-phospho-L-lactate transferase
MATNVNNSSQRKILALSGGVGGAKLVLGLSRVLAADELTIVANTGDDFEHLGLHISPDLDTVMYTLAGLNNQEQGWGLAGETWSMLAAMEQLGGESWFRLGDRDIATHLRRTELLAAGKTLTEVTAELCQQLSLSQTLLPMSDDSVRTFVDTERGELAFQHYFVREQCAPAVRGFSFRGLESANPNPALMNLLNDDILEAVIICPSNPFVSIDPILKLPGVTEALKRSSAKVIAVSPIVSGMAIKGPAAKMMRELSMPVTADAVAHYYGDLLDLFVIDESDVTLGKSIEQRGVSVATTPTVMKTIEDREHLARFVLEHV